MGYLKVKYVTTGKFLYDHVTKPLQGAAFQKFRADIQGIPEDTSDTELVWNRPDDTFIPTL